MCLISLLGPYFCTKFECPWDSSLTRDEDWGYYGDTDRTKHACQLRCSNDDDCETYEWSDSPDNEKCIWWKKGRCQHGSNTISDDPKFQSCKKLGESISIFRRLNKKLY